MNFNTHCRIGTRVVVSPQHWLRPNDIGCVIDQKHDGKLRWLVQFEMGHRGGGIDGDQLWLDQHDIYEVISEADMGDVMPMQSPTDALSPWEDPPGSKAPATNTFEREIYRYEKSVG